MEIIKKDLFSHSILLFSIIILTVFQVQGQQVDTQPSNITVLEGNSTNLLCRWGQPLQYCRIEIPGVKVLNLSPNYENAPGYTYFGIGLDKGQCGVTIQNVRSANHGQVKCFLGVAGGDELQGLINFVVAMQPAAPELQFMAPNPNGNPLRLGDELIAKCISRDGRPAAEIDWFINDEPIVEGLEAPEIVDIVTTSNHPNEQVAITITQTLRRTIQAIDDRRTLVCRTSNLADRGQPQIARHQLHVQYPPQPLPATTIYGLIIGTTALINVTIRSNPAPRIDWIVDSNTIPGGSQNGRYEAYNPIDVGNGFYNVTLSIASLTLEDTTMSYRLKASNLEGAQDFTIRISSTEAAAVGLNVGTIIGIVLAILVLLITGVLIIFARFTGRWCFSGTGGSLKGHPSETLDASTRDANNALLSQSSSPANLTDINSNNARIQSVYNPTTIPNIGGRKTVNDYSPMVSVSSSFSEHDVNQGIGGGGGGGVVIGNPNENGLPRSSIRASIHRWLPSQQRELLQKQASILAGAGGGKINQAKKETDIF